jgi:hypothetical protein
MEPFTVIYVEPAEGLELWQFFECMADNDDHAEEQCTNAYPTATILWVNKGQGRDAREMR